MRTKFIAPGAKRRAGRRTLAAALVLLALTPAGCGSSTKVDSKSTTVGQELQDLEAARNKGLLTEDEYQKQRSKIMKGQ